MRHRVAGRSFSRKSQHRKMMFRNMLVSLLDHERIRTTLFKAKELRSIADKIITLGKKGSLHARRQAFALLRNESIVKKLFDDIAPRFKERAGGYTRIYRLGWRAGDNAPLSLIELVTEIPAKEAKKKSTVKKAREVLKKVTPKGKGKAITGEKGKEKKEPEKKPKAAKAEDGKKASKQKIVEEKGKMSKGKEGQKKNKKPGSAL
jgi:large subunit ribosomal protein L17